ncbi:hypothetical protein ACJIZ3_022921 [Penstemon smallii]|uniref:SANT domain-containing protein n=1 Tax=Penstemon smallii TaxID=265156 RepID=A0ABD3TPY1_9LAMI
MPPEPLPWGDRRDFRKHERSASDPRLGATGGFGGGGPHRWREQHHAPLPHPYHNRHQQQQQQQQQQRWYSDFRSSRPIPPGHGKQGGWHMYSDDTSHGFVPFGSRYGTRNLEDENCRPFVSRGDGRYIRNGRENRASSFSQKEWKAPSCEPAASMSGPGRPTSEANTQRSAENTHACLNNTSKSNDDSNPHDSANPLGQSHSLPKEEQDKSGVTGDVLTIADPKSEKENGLGSIDWKPMKWPRSGSLSSRGSGFSPSSSSKSMGVESMQTVAEVQPKNLTPVQSPSEDAVACITSTAPAPLDEDSSRKKPRLGWGEGLAKYEKKKVEGPEDCGMKNDMVVSVINTEAVQSHVGNLLDKSPRVASLLDFASPATPSSVACSSSPGVEEKESTKVANVDHDTTNLSSSPSIVSQMHYDGPTFNLEKLDIAAIANLSTLINELLSDDPSSAETGYVQTSSMNKLLLWKVDVLKALETTESEIDSLETELKSLITEPKSCCLPASSSSLPGECDLKSSEDLDTPSKFSVRPAPLQAVSFGDIIVENMPVALERENVNEDADSPGSATSKFVEVQASEEDIFPVETAECVEGFVNLNSNNSSNLGEKCLENAINDEQIAGHIVNCELTVANSSQDFSRGSNVCYDVDNIYETIIASNKYSASRALEELNKLLPSKQPYNDTLTLSHASSLQRDVSVVKDRFLRRKRFIQFKEKVITLKFKIFQHFWKEGRIVSVRKLRIKSHKKFDLSRTGHKKNRSFSRLRSSSSAGSPQTVPPDEVIEFINGLLSESAFKPYRNILKMPALILDKKEKMMSKFISNNGLVEDPCAAEKERSMINPWTSEEMDIFIDKLAIFGKDFKKIASCLDHKTIADCVEFYYKNHKSDCFEKARKKPGFTKQRKSQSTTYLVPGKRWNREQNAVSLDMLGAASAIVANVDNNMEIQQKCTSRLFIGASSSYKASRGDDGSLQRSESMDMYTNERETIAADVLAGICGSISSEAMSSCITSSVDPGSMDPGSVDPGDGYQEWKYQRSSSSTKRPLTLEVAQNGDECSDESCGEMDPTDWTDEEKYTFIQAVSSYGKDFVMISQAVRTRSREQCQGFFIKAKKCLGLDLIQLGAGNTLSGDVNGGGSDIEDACINDPGCKMEEDIAPPDLKFNHEPDIVRTQDLKPDFKVCEENYGPCLLDPMASGPVLENSLMGDRQVDEKPVTDFIVASKERNGANDACITVQKLGTTGASSNAESVRVVEGDDNALSNRSCEAESRDFGGISDGNCREEKEGKGPKDNLDHKKDEDKDSKSSQVNDTNCAVSEMNSYPQKAGHVCNPSGAAAHSSIQVEKLSESHKKADFENSSAEKSPFMPLQKNGHLTSVKSSTLFPVPIKYQKYNGLSAVGTNRISDKHSQRFVRTGESQQHFSGYSLSDPVKPAQILRGYPVSVQTMKEMNGNVNKKRSVSLQNFPERDGVFHSGRHTEFSLQKCSSSSRHQNKAVEALFPAQEQGRDNSRPHSGCSSDGDKPQRNGDVKLFGKILISSQEKLEYCDQQANDNNNRQHRGTGCQSLNLKVSGNPKVNLDSAAQSKFDPNNYIGSENIPVTSFGFWDGNRMQKGFPSLSDSARLLTKYPAAFGNYTLPTRKFEQPLSLHGNVKYTDYPLDGFSVFPGRELNSSSTGVADYQLFRNREVQPPFTIDMKQPQDVLLTEMQRRNGFDIVSGMQHEARSMVGIRGGVLLGGQCSSGVSDPVAAMKMHYAQTEHFSVHLKDDDKWRSNGNVGR